MKLKLPQVTLLGIDCVNVERLQAAMDVSEKEVEFSVVKLLTSLPTDDPRAVNIPHIGSIEEFSRFCIEDLDQYVDTDYVLLVQYDGFVLSGERWFPEFLNYDYIGAPLETSTWTRIDPNVPLPKYIVGNGGFCLRSKKFLQLSAQFVKEGKITKLNPEDVALSLWYKNLFEKEGMKYPSPELAMKFSVQLNYGEYEKPFGFHGFYEKNMLTLHEEHPGYPVKYFLPRIRWARLMKIKKVFGEIAVEAYYTGAIARGITDLDSSIDVWITFKDKELLSVLEKRAEYYAQIGDIVAVQETVPLNLAEGLQSTITYKTQAGLFRANVSLYPASKPCTDPERKKLF